MANTILVQLLILLLSQSLWAKADRVYSESYLGEKNIESYSERYQPLIFQDIYQGKMSFVDDLFFRNFFDPYLFHDEKDYAFFLRSELNGGAICSNELLSKHFDDIKYSYRLITLSYLLEAQWHLKNVTDHFRLKKGCGFEVRSWIKDCRPKSLEMKKFMKRLDAYLPSYNEPLPPDYTLKSWWEELSQGKLVHYSHYRLKKDCNGKCTLETVPEKLKDACDNNQQVMNLICSENDELYGLSTHRDAYYLLGLSNIPNTYNKQGEAMGCLRRFSEVMAHKEARYQVLAGLFPQLQSFLREKYQERFLQGRVFFLGSGKEFEEKGLTDLYVKEQPLKIASSPEPSREPVKVIPIEKVVKKSEPSQEVKVSPRPAPKKGPVKEIRGPVKSAFLIASEIRQMGDLERVEVDMLKLKYDYVFTLNMINNLSFRLKTFMTREALVEMMTYDKLGTAEGPVPLLFLKFMIDMQEHHGLWNLTAVLGNKFYVSNEIDSAFRPEAELIELLNSEATGNQWQIFILRP